MNSANLGPYGDAIETELIPAIEKQFRGLGQGWARFIYGGSTGGWEALAVQMFYPEHYNGAFVACPDPVDFRAYTVIDLYKDKNAYYREGAHRRMMQPGMRNYLGHILVTSARDQPVRARAGNSRPLRRTIRHLASRLLASRRRRLSQTDLQQRNRRDRPRGRRLLERALRPAQHPRARLADARPQATRQAPHLLRQRRQLFPQQRRLPAGRFSQVRRTRPTKAKSNTATAPNTAGTATPRSQTISRACTTTPCTCQKS